MNELSQTQNTQAKAFFLCGGLLILSGAGLLYVCCLMASEAAANSLLSRDDAHELLTNHVAAALAVFAFLTVALAATGFPASKVAYPSWYMFITGYIPGYLILAGWRAVRDGLACRRGLPSHGLRGVIIKTAIVGAFDVIILCLIVKGISES